MTDIIENMSKEELVAKCTNQRLEIVNLLNCANNFVGMSADRGQVIRAAIKHLKDKRPTVALSTLQGHVKRHQSVQCLRELANGEE